MNYNTFLIIGQGNKNWVLYLPIFNSFRVIKNSTRNTAQATLQSLHQFFKNNSNQICNLFFSLCSVFCDLYFNLICDRKDRTDKALGILGDKVMITEKEKE
uniref:Uncharacterized protein n=1 Tax=Cacopsylla melanoneura TaxID=428564 RepID=A0A8D8LE43_9HEMI